MFGTKPAAAPSGFLLDTYTGAAVAYSLRQLKTGVTAVVKVRRTVGSPATADFTATEITDGTLAAWVGAGNNGFVDTWYDQSGSGNHASQATTSKQYKIVSSGALITEGSLPCLEGASDGTNSLTFTTRLTGIRSVFIVNKFTNNNTSAACFLLGDNSVAHYTSGVSGVDTVGAYLSTSFSLDVVRNGSNYLNAVLSTLTTTLRSLSRRLVTMIHTGSATASRISDDRSNAGRSYRGTLQEVIIYETDKTSDRAAIETEINTHYAIY